MVLIAPACRLSYVRMGLRDVSSTSSFAPSCQGMGMETSSESLPACGPSTEYSHSALSSELSSTAIDSDNPFTDSLSGSPSQTGRFSQNPELSPLRNCQDTSFRKTAFMDDPKAMSVPMASNWKLPRSLSRGNSQAAPESSPLRWCGYSWSGSLFTEYSNHVLLVASMFCLLHPCSARHVLYFFPNSLAVLRNCIAERSTVQVFFKCTETSS